MQKFGGKPVLLFQVTPFCHSCRVFPEKECLFPELDASGVELVESTGDSITISLPEPMQDSKCRNLLPTTVYQVTCLNRCDH